ncbi:MAG: FliH/SctL family protein [Myxococcota bacterium]
MSSFRPDQSPMQNAFVATPLNHFGQGRRDQEGRSGFGAAGFISDAAHSAASAGGVSQGMAEGGSGAMDRVDAEPEVQMHHLTDIQLEEIEAAAYARGEEAAQQAALGLEAACAAIENAGLELARAAASDLASNREGTLALAAEMAQAWVGQALRSDSALMGSVLDGVLSEIRTEEDAQVFLSPKALDAFAAQEAERVTSWTEKFGVALRSDPKLGDAEFRVETAMHHVDGRLEAVRARLIEALSEAVEAAPPEDAE